MLGLYYYIAKSRGVTSFKVKLHVFTSSQPSPDDSWWTSQSWWCMVNCPKGFAPRPDGGSNPGSSVYETDALPLGHRAQLISKAEKIYYKARGRGQEKPWTWRGIRLGEMFAASMKCFRVAACTSLAGALSRDRRRSCDQCHGRFGLKTWSLQVDFIRF